MLIIVEGPNCAGKSTLVERVVTYLSTRTAGTVTRLHRGPIDDRHPLDEYVVPLLGYRPGQGDHLVCDRWHVGESVYPFVYPRPSKLDRPTSRYITQFLRSRGALLVHVTATGTVLHDRLVKRGDENDRVNRHTLRVERDMFDVHCRAEWRDGLSLNVVESPVIDVELIVSQAAAAEEVATPTAEFTTYVGGPAPLHLLLGDVRGSSACLNAPAFGPYPSTSGHYLLRCLELTALQFKYTGLANACDVDDPVELWEILGRPRVATLGRNAARRLQQLRVPFKFGAAPHPQYVRRFWHAHRGEYGRVVLDALTRGEYTPSWRPH